MMRKFSRRWGNGERKSAVAQLMTMDRCLLAVTYFLLCQSARADLRYRAVCELKQGPLQQLNGLAPGGDLLADCNQEVFTKGNLEITKGKNRSVLIDHEKGTQTILDHKAKTWARQSMTELAAEIEKAKAAALAGTGSPKFTLLTQGVLKTIAGVSATGTLSRMEMDLPISNETGGPELSLSMDIEVWSSTNLPGATESMRVDAVRKRSGNPAMRALETMVGGLPGADELLAINPSKQGLPLEIRLVTRFKGTDKPQLGDTESDPLGIIATLREGGALMEMVMRFSEHNTKPIAAAEFEIPKNYQEIR